MNSRVAVAACAGAMFAFVSLCPTASRAQNSGAIIGGLAGGVLGGVIAGSIAAQAARERPVVVYARPRTVRVVHVVRPEPRQRVVRARQRPMQPAAGPSNAQVVNVSADPFATSQGSATTAVKQTH